MTKNIQKEILAKEKKNKNQVKLSMCPSTWQYPDSTAIIKDIIITYFCALFPLLCSNKMIGGGRGGGGGGGIMGDLLVWEVLLFLFKPGEWGAVVVTWFPTKGKQIDNDDVILSGLVVYPL